MFRIGDIVKIKNSNRTLCWYHDNSMTIIDVIHRSGQTYPNLAVVNYRWNDNTNTINFDHIELVESLNDHRIKKLELLRTPG